MIFEEKNFPFKLISYSTEKENNYYFVTSFSENHIFTCPGSVP